METGRSDDAGRFSHLLEDAPPSGGAVALIDRGTRTCRFGWDSLLPPLELARTSARPGGSQSSSLPDRTLRESAAPRLSLV